MTEAELIERLQAELRKHVVKPRGYWNYGNPQPEFVVTTHRCELCGNVWPNRVDETHKDGCILAPCSTSSPE